MFDPARPKRLFVASDGGVVSTDNLGGKFVASYNRELLDLQFGSVPGRDFYGNSTANPAVPGMLAGGLQDNGVVYAVPRATPWRRVQDDDGGAGVFIETGQLVSANACCPGGPAGISRPQGTLELRDPSTIPIKRRDNSRDNNGLPDPIAERVAGAPALVNNRQRMYAVGGNGQPPQTLYGLFADSKGGGAAWRKLADLPGRPAAQIWSMASADGTTVFVGTSTNTDKQGNVNPAGLWRVDGGHGPATALPAVPAFSGGVSDPTGVVSRVVLDSETNPTVAYNAFPQGTVFTLTQTGGSAAWSPATGLPGTQIFGLAIDPLDNVYVATDDQVFISRDHAESFTSVSDGLPRRPHNSHLFFSHSRGGVALYLSTFGRSVWTARFITRLGEQSGIAFGRLIGGRDGQGFFLATPNGLEAVTPTATSAAELRRDFRALLNLVPGLTRQLKTVEDGVPLTTTGWPFRTQLHEAVGALELAVAQLDYLADEIRLTPGDGNVGPGLGRASALLIDAADVLRGLSSNARTWDRGLTAANSTDRDALRQLVSEVIVSVASLSQLESDVVGSV